MDVVPAGVLFLCDVSTVLPRTISADPLIRRWDWSAFWLEMIGWVSGRGIVGGLGARTAGVVGSSTGYGQGQIQVRVTGSVTKFFNYQVQKSPCNHVASSFI